MHHIFSESLVITSKVSPWFCSDQTKAQNPKFTVHKHTVARKRKGSVCNFLCIFVGVYNKDMKDNDRYFVLLLYIT